MNTAVSLWGYEVDGATVIWTITIYLLISIVLIILIPKLSVPYVASATTDERAKIIEMRGKVRSSVMQVLGGIIVVATFIGTLQQIRGTEDAFNQKKAELFAKSVKDLTNSTAAPEARSEAMYILSYVARSDRSYHRAVYDILSSYVVTASKAACKDDSYKQANYETDRTIQIAMRIIGERRLTDDQTGKRFNLEDVCLAGLDLRDEWAVVKGLTNARLSGSKMLRIDFTRAELSGAELMGIEAGDWHNSTWTSKKGRELHKGVDGDERRGTDSGKDRRALVAHFIDANLEKVDFSGAGLEGADFSGAKLTDARFDGANISRVSFKGAQNLKPAQFEKSCVGNIGSSAEDHRLDQPYFSKDMRAELAKNDKFKEGIPRCP